MKNVEKNLRHPIFVLTAGEKKAIFFVVAAFVLGVTTKHYRDHHPRALPQAEPTVHLATKSEHRTGRKPRTKPQPATEPDQESDE